MLRYTSRGFIWQWRWNGQGGVSLPLIDSRSQTAEERYGAVKLLPSSACVQQRAGKPLCVLARLTSAFHASNLLQHRCALTQIVWWHMSAWINLLKVFLQPFFSFCDWIMWHALDHPRDASSVPRSHLQAQYLPIWMWCFSKCFSVMLQWIKHWRLLSSCPKVKTWNFGCVAGACKRAGLCVCCHRSASPHNSAPGGVCVSSGPWQQHLPGCVYWDIPGSRWQWWLGVADVCCLCSRLTKLRLYMM